MSDTPLTNASLLNISSDDPQPSIFANDRITGEEYNGRIVRGDRMEQLERRLYAVEKQRDEVIALLAEAMRLGNQLADRCGR